jgi:homocysteine S-methyltransferase
MTPTPLTAPATPTTPTTPNSDAQEMPAVRRPADNPFLSLLERQRAVILDGGLATALESRGHDLSHHLWSARVLVEEPAEITAVHEAYLRAGADCIATVSYQATVEGFARMGLEASQALAMLDRSTNLAVEARDRVHAERAAHGPGAHSADAPRPKPLVAASIGPYGAYLADGSEYTGRYDLDHDGLHRFHDERFQRLAQGNADLVAFETIPSLVEAQVLAALIAESDRWAWVSFSCRDDRHLNDGTPIEDAVDAIKATPGLAALGINCTAPRYITPLIQRIRSQTDLPVMAYPNSGETYDPTAKGWTDGPADAGWENGPSEWLRAGAQIIGGCCRVGPETVTQLKRLVTSPAR